MKIIRKSKKGFTIVELVIVIAVIAVLAAVLIPTFISLTAKANKASDDSLVTSLNKALAIEEVDHDMNNMHDAVEGLKREGYLASTLVTKSDQKLLYDLDKNRFLLEEDRDTDKAAYKYWTIADSYDADSQNYSIYASDKFETANIANLKVGFDAGDTDVVQSISYVGKTDATQEVVIRTNGANSQLTVNAPNDTVHHYDYLDELNVQAIANASYHEHGKIAGKATFAKGHLVIESGAEVNNVVVPSTAEANSVTIAVNSSSKLQSVIDYSTGGIKSEGTSIPSTVPTIAAEEGKVAYVKSTNTKYATFAEAYAATGENDLIIMLDDAAIDGSSGNKYDVLINKSIKIDGNGNELTTARPLGSGGGNDSSRAFQVENLDNDKYINVAFQNITLHVNAKTDVFVSPSSQYINLTIDNCDFTSAQYPINVRSSSQFINIDIKNGSYIKGWCALNFYGSLSTLKVTDSVLHGYNTYAGTTNEYSVIVLDGGAYWGEAEGIAARANNIEIKNSTLVAEVKPGCSEEYWISFQYGSSQNAQVTVINSKILDKLNGEDKTTVVNFDKANTGDSFTMVLTNSQITALQNAGLTVTENPDGTYTVRRLA